MRELEFLPSWYNQTRRRKRLVALEAWLFLAVIIGLGSWVGLVQRNVRASDLISGDLQRQLDRTHNEQRILAEQLVLQQELQARDQLIASLGIPIQMTRLLQSLDSVMPKEMSLIEFKCITEEQVRPMSSLAGVRPGAEKQLDRRMKVKLMGVAPSDVDLASFLAGLTNLGFFDQVAVTYARDRNESGHLMREFEVTFSMNLSQQSGN